MNKRIIFEEPRTHPYQHVRPSKKANFAFVPISKNASTTLANHPSLCLDGQRHFKEFSDAQFYAIFRNPIERFISSIPETLSRFNQDLKFKKNIHVELNKLSSDQPLDNFIHQYIDIIEKNDFYDAHHRPQVHFLCTPEGVSWGSYKIFPLSTFNDSVRTICELHNISFQKCELHNTSFQKIEIGRRRNTIRRLAGFVRTGGWKPNNLQKRFQARKSWSNNLYGVDLYKKMIAVNAGHIKLDKEIIERLNYLYSDDILIMDKLNSCKDTFLEINENTILSTLHKNS